MVRSIACRYPIRGMALVALIFLLFWGTASADTLTVCKSGCNYSSIQVAIDAAGPGDIVEVQSGVYYEALNVTEQIILRGVDTGQGRPVIDVGTIDTGAIDTETIDTEMMHAGMMHAGGKKSAVSIKAYGCVLEGFGIKNASEAIGIDVTSSNNIIRDNIISNCREGISLDKSSYNTVTGNNISHNEGNGLSLYASIGNIINDNNVSYCRDGISLIRSSRNILKNNTMSGNLHSFRVEEMFDNEIDTSNLVDGKPIYYMVGSFGSVIDSSSNAGTVYCINCRNITIKDLELMNNTYGIYLSQTPETQG
jgi:parallel beta-helix repeat protein